MFYDSHQEEAKRERSRWYEKIDIATQEANENARKADENAKKADENARKADENARKADENARKADENARKADENAKKADENARKTVAEKKNQQDITLETLLTLKDPLSGKALFEKHCRGRDLSHEVYKSLIDKIFHCSTENLAETIREVMQQQVEQ